MKLQKVLAGVAVIAALALTGCAEQEPVRGTVTGGDTAATTTTATETTTTTAETTTTTTAAEVRLGSTTGGVYQNTFIGIGCKFDSSWVIYSDEEIREVNELTMDSLSDEYAEQLANAAVLYDFFASTENGDSININLEKVTAIQALAIDTETYVDMSISSLEDALAGTGVANVKAEKVKRTFAGEETFSATISMTIEGVPFYETVVCLKRGNYFVSITVGAFEQSHVNEILNRFYAL